MVIPVSPNMAMRRLPHVALHTKACLDALGPNNGLSAITEAGFSEIVLWAGEAGEYLASIDLVQRMGLRIVALALPKVHGLEGPPSAHLLCWITHAAERGVPAVSLMFGDSADANVPQNGWTQLGRWMRSVDVPLLVENNGKRSERFANPRELTRLLEEVPELAITLDLGHLASSGHADSNLATLSSRIVAVDVHDNDGIHDLHLPLGRGIGSGSFLSALKRLPALPQRIVIETDAHSGSNRAAWIAAICDDRALLEVALSSTFDACA